jgi:hypothetical protein
MPSKPISPALLTEQQAAALLLEQPALLPLLCRPQAGKLLPGAGMPFQLISPVRLVEEQQAAAFVAGATSCAPKSEMPWAVRTTEDHESRPHVSSLLELRTH